MDGSFGKANFELAHHQPSTVVYWHLDGEYIGETSGVHQMQLSPSKGKHRVTVVDEVGNTLGVEFGVEWGVWGMIYEVFSPEIGLHKK